MKRLISSIFKNKYFKNENVPNNWFSISSCLIQPSILIVKYEAGHGKFCVVKVVANIGIVYKFFGMLFKENKGLANLTLLNNTKYCYFFVDIWVLLKLSTNGSFIFLSIHVTYQFTYITILKALCIISSYDPIGL